MGLINLAEITKYLKNEEVKVKLYARNVYMSDADGKLTTTEVVFGFGFRKDSMTGKLNSPIVFINEGLEPLLNKKCKVIYHINNYKRFILKISIINIIIWKYYKHFLIRIIKINIY